MQRLLRVVRLLSVVLWIGGLSFFAFVLAPIAFGRLASTHEAGLVVGGTLNVLHWMGLVCGGAFCVATGILWLRAAVFARTGFVVELGLMAVMLGVTAYSQFSILPTMERDRVAAGGDVNAAATTNAGRVDFERLHGLSEKLEGLVFFCGLGVVFMMTREAEVGDLGKVAVR